LSYLRFLIKVRALPERTTTLDFIDAYVDGRLDTFGTWGEHVESWRAARGDSDSFLLLRYEDMRNDPVAWLAKAAAFLRLDASEDGCRQAVERASLGQMQKLERQEASEVPELRSTRSDIPFIGEGRVGGGSKELSDHEQDRIVTRWGRPMRELGYL
jgi:hypothetical protein